MNDTLRAIAIYLPQFHPIPENNEWWGTGFTEWTNVTKAKPLFKEHYQPHLPTDLGFYDLRLNQTMIAQASLAKQFGIYGFCFYHYWFSGKKILETPVELMMETAMPDFPFMLCWANENWTRNWDGQNNKILLKQEYSEEDDYLHIKSLIRYFKDPRYIRVNEKPVFVIYRPSLFPDIKKTLKIWREQCKKEGVGELYLMFMQSFGNYTVPEEIGFDAAIEFQPDFWDFPTPNYAYPNNYSLINKVRKFLGMQKSSQDYQIFQYDEVINKMISREAPKYKRYRSLFPMWDNTARRDRGATIIYGSTPELYGKWLKSIVHDFKAYEKDENFIFINAWNEWAEGNHLEPCIKFGSQYLKATKSALNA